MRTHIFLGILLILLPLYSSAQLFGLTSNCADPLCSLCYTSDTTNCQTCSGPLIITAGICSCPAGKYALFGSLTCLDCDTSACVTCSGSPTNCTSCTSTQFLYNGKCYAQCSSSQYFSTVSLACLACDPTCLTCNGPGSTSCTSCNTGAGTLVNGQCTCASGQYKDSSTYMCSTCYSTCKECNGALATNCTACAPTGLMLQSNGECKCSAGTYLNTSPVSCDACNSVCQGCTGPSSSECTSCKNNLVFSSGSCSCGSGTYYDSGSNSCLTCNSKCGDCNGPASTQCTSCKNGLVLSSGSCNCPDGTYYDSGSLACAACDPSCATCTGPADYQCSTCDATYTFVSGQCECSSGCSCPTGKYFNSSSLTCMPCSSSCVDCLGPASNQCTSCDSDKYLSSAGSGTCLCASSTSCNCPSGTYFDSTALVCSSCYSTCQTCNGAASNNCVSCKNNLVFSSGQCGCPTGSYLHPTLNICLDCDPSCLTCTGPYDNQCTSCYNNMVLLSNSCSCPSGNYADYGSLTCNTCDGSCEECSGPETNQCTACSTSKVLENGYCLDDCGSHQYRSYDGSCQDCDSSCQECTGPSSSECTSCFPTSYLDTGVCKTTGCYPGCRTCQGVLIDQCTSCLSGYLFYDKNNGLGTCTTQCPSYSYLTVENGVQICEEKLQIDNAISYSGGFNQIEISFNKNIQDDLNTILDNIKVIVVFRSDQPAIPYTISYSLTPDKQGIIIALSFVGYLLPGNILNIEYGEFITNATINYYMQNNLQQVSLMEAYQYSDSAQAAINTTSSINTVASQANKVFSWASAFVLRSVHSMRSQVVEDMLECFIYMNVNFPPNFVQFANASQDDLDNLIPNFGEFIVDQFSFDIISSRILQADGSGDSVLGSDNAIDMYLPDKSFLINFGSEITMFLFAFLLLILVEILKCILMKFKSSKPSKPINLIERVCNYSSYALRWNFMLNLFISAYPQLSLYAMIEVANVRELTTRVDYVKYISGVIGLFFTVFGLLFVIFVIRRVFVILRKKYQSNHTVNSEKEANFLKRFAVFHHTFNSKKGVQLFYPLLLIVRSFGFSLVIVFLQKVPWAQILYITLSTVILLALLIIVKPFKSKLEQILTLIYEVLFLTACGLTIVLQIYNRNHLADIDGRSRLGYAICGCSLLMVILNLINAPLEVWEVKKQIKEYKERLKVTPATSLNLQTPTSKVTQITPIITPETTPTNAKRSESIVQDGKIPETTIKRRKTTPLIVLKTIQEEDNSNTEAIKNSATLKKDRKAEAWKIHVKTIADKNNDEKVKLNESSESPAVSPNQTRQSTLLNQKSIELGSGDEGNPKEEEALLSRKRNFTFATLKALRSSSKVFTTTLEELDALKASSGDEDHLKPIRSPNARRRLLSKGSLLSVQDLAGVKQPQSKAESDSTPGGSGREGSLKFSKSKISSEEEVDKSDSNRLTPSNRLSPQLSQLRLSESRFSIDFDSSRTGLVKSPASADGADDPNGSLLETYFERKHTLRKPRGKKETLTSIYVRNMSKVSDKPIFMHANSTKDV